MTTYRSMSNVDEANVRACGGRGHGKQLMVDWNSNVLISLNELFCIKFINMMTMIYNIINVFFCVEIKICELLNERVSISLRSFMMQGLMGFRNMHVRELNQNTFSWYYCLHLLFKAFFLFRYIKSEYFF